MRRKAVAQRMQIDALRDTRRVRRLVEDVVELVRGQRCTLSAAGKEQALLHRHTVIGLLRPDFPPVTQQRERLRRQHDEAIFLPL